MKTFSPFVHDLVVRLTKSEKRYVKIQARAGDKHYMQLLEALLAQKVYDEEQLLRDHAGAGFVKHLAVNKRYLYDLLLRSLANFGRKRIEDKVANRLQAVNVLLEKGLLPAAWRELKKGQRTAEKFELFELQIILLGLEKKLLSRREFRQPDNTAINQVFQLERKCLEELMNTNEYWYLAQQIAQFQLQVQKIQTPKQQAELASLVASPQFQQLALATNFRSKLYFYQANATYQFMLGNVAEAYTINSTFLDLLEVNPHFLKIYAERYLATLNNMLIDSMIIGKYDTLEAGIERLEKVLLQPEFKSVKHIEAWVFRQRYLLLFNWNLSRKAFHTVLDWIPEVAAGLDRYGKKIARHHRITFIYLIAYSLWQNGHAEDALDWNNRLLDDARQDVVKEIFYFARVLNLLIHFDLENYSLLESLLQSTPRYLKSKRPIYATEKALFRFLNNQIKAVDKQERKVSFAAFQTQINILRKAPEEQRVFSYLDLQYWLSRGDEKTLFPPG